LEKKNPRWASDYTKNKNNDKEYGRELREGNKVHIFIHILEIIVQYSIYRVLKITNDKDK